jgi:salicylate hydroxylase
MKIGIVGLGLGGATAAAAMARRGLNFNVFEQVPQIREVGAGVATWPNTVRLMNRLGLADRLSQIGCAAGSNPIRNAAGKVLHHVPPKSYDDTNGYCLHRAELLQCLAALIPPDRIRLNSRCVAVSIVGETVAVTLQDGSCESFDVLIGADGIHSTIAPLVTQEVEPIYSNLAAYRGLVINDPEDRFEEGTLWTDRRKYFVAFPVSGGRLINFVGVVPTPGTPEESWFMEGRTEDLRAEYASWDPAIGRILSRVETTFRWGLYYRNPTPNMVRGRLALMGDAAHPMLINAGQGVGQAIEDGVALAVLLDGARAADVEERLRLYEHMRLPRATAVQDLSRRNAQFMHEVFPLQPGESRPERASPVEWILDYDVEREAERLLADGASRRPTHTPYAQEHG